MAIHFTFSYSVIFREFFTVMYANYYDMYQKTGIFSDEFFGQFLRTLGKCYVRCADVGECYATLSKITDKDGESWYKAWYEMANTLKTKANISWEANHFITAAYAYLRAAEYYRASEFFLRANPDDPRVIPCFDQLQFCFERAMHRLHPGSQKIWIPYDDQTLSGYLFFSDQSPKATLIVPGGYDSTFEENYALVPAALLHGYHILIFDGPGQGHVLRRQKLYMRADFEHVVSQVVDWLDEQSELGTSSYVLIGRSFGGYLAPRAACSEKRLAALICDPGQMDIAGSLNKMLPPNLMMLLKEGKADELNACFYQLFSENPMKEFYFKSRMYTHGLATPFDYLQALSAYTFVDRVQEITCPTLVCDNPSDRISNRGNTLYEALSCEKTYVMFDAKLGAGMHCEADANGQFQQVIFDWLDERFTQ